MLESPHQYFMPWRWSRGIVPLGSRRIVRSAFGIPCVQAGLVSISLAHVLTDNKAFVPFLCFVF